MGIVSAMMQVGAAIKHAVAALFKVTHSLRFDGASDRLSFTPSSTTDNQTFTLSAWVRRSSTGSAQYIFGAYSGNSDAGWLGVFFNSANNLRIGGYSTTWLSTTTTYTDTSEWLHVVASVDAPNQQVKLWVNGLEPAHTETAPGTGQTFPVNTASVAMTLGRIDYNGGSYYLNGQLAEIHFVDGTAYDQTYFGETNANSQWVPKEVTGVTYGNNGFYLPFDGNGQGVALLLNGEDATIADVSSASTALTVGSSVSQNTSTVKYGSGSVEFVRSAGVNSVITYTGPALSGDFTVELWWKPKSLTASASDEQIWELRGINTAYGVLGYNPISQFLYWYFNGSYRIQSNTTLTTNWQHIAIVRSGGVNKMYVDGVAQSQTWSDTTSIASGTHYLGQRFQPVSTNYYGLDAYVDDFRLTPGLARDIAAGFSGGTPISGGGWDVSLTDDFQYGGSLGRDASTSGNDFAVNGGITPDDQLIDTPNLRFATLDPSNKGSGVTLSEANFKAAKSTAGFHAVRSTDAIPASAKVYAEYLLDTNAGAICGVGNASASVTTYVGVDANSWSWQPTSGPKVYHAGSWTSYGPQTATNDVVMIAVDRAAGKVYWGVNGEWITSSGTTTSFASALEGASDTDITNASSLYFMYSGQNNQNSIWNFGQDHTFAGAKSPLSSPKTDSDGNGEFRYQPPPGFKALATSY